VPLAQFLVYRWHTYMTSAPQDAPDVADLVRVTDANDVVVTAPADDDPVVLASVRRRLAAIEGERARMLETAAAIEGQLSERRERAARGEASSDDAHASLVAAVDVGEAAVPATMGRAAAERGRPVLGSPWVLAAIYGASAIAILCEAWQFALPWLDLTGVDTSNLAVEWSRAPLSVITGAVFGLAVAGGLFALYDHVVIGLGALTAEGRSRRQRLVSLAGVTAESVLVFAASWAMAMLREGFGRGSIERQDALEGAAARASGASATWVFVVITLLAPLGTALILHVARRIRASRTAVRDAQRAWDAAEEARRATRERGEERGRLVDAARAESDRDVQTLVARKAACEERAEVLEQVLRETADSQRKFATAFARRVGAQLHQDRHAYLVQAHKLGADALLQPRTRDESSGVRWIARDASRRHAQH
jgi:hypothetical protein